MGKWLSEHSGTSCVTIAVKAEHGRMQDWRCRDGSHSCGDSEHGWMESQVSRAKDDRGILHVGAQGKPVMETEQKSERQEEH